MDADLREHVFDLPLEETELAKTLVNNADYAGKKLSTDVRVPGRIGRPEYFEFWRDELKASDFVLNVIKEGYKFPFVSAPPASFCKNNKSFYDHKEFAYHELLRLESLGCIERVTEQPYITLPLSVVFSKKLRLVVDASRHLNPFLKDRKIKLEDLNVSEQMLKQGDFQMTTDLDSGYWHVPLNDDMKKFVGVHFELDSGEKLFWVWKVLFLGIKDAAWIFTKLLVPHKQYCRSHGIRMQIYMDDQKVLGSDFESCKADNDFANSALEKAGWTVKPEKCEGPSQNLKFLGLMNDSVSMKYFVPEDKGNAICELIDDILQMKKVHIRILAKLMGKIQFCIKAMGPAVKLLCRSSHYLISKAKSWNSMIVLNDLAKQELSYLLENFWNLNGHPMRPSLSTSCIDVKISSDASDKGFCVYEVCDGNDILLKRPFTDFESNLSSTHRELLAFYDFYTSDKALVFKNSNVVHYTDNANCETILSVGSRNVILQPLVLEIFLAWKSLNIKVDVVHLKRNDPIIEFADFESRNFDLHDFSLDFDSFYLISSLFGEFEIDCFASSSNKKCVQYYSKFKDSSSSGTNFFAQKLAKVNLFVFPPIHLIIPTLYHLQKFKSFGCLIVPKWISSYFWSFICNDGRHFNKFVKCYFLFSPCFVAGEHVINDTFRGVKNFDTLAIAFDFSVQNAFQSNCDSRFCILKGCPMCSS